MPRRGAAREACATRRRPARARGLGLYVISEPASPKSRAAPDVKTRAHPSALKRRVAGRAGHDLAEGGRRPGECRKNGTRSSGSAVFPAAGGPPLRGPAAATRSGAYGREAATMNRFRG